MSIDISALPVGERLNAVLQHIDDIGESDEEFDFDAFSRAHLDLDVDAMEVESLLNETLNDQSVPVEPGLTECLNAGLNEPESLNESLDEPEGLIGGLNEPESTLHKVQLNDAESVNKQTANKQTIQPSGPVNKPTLNKRLMANIFNESDSESDASIANEPPQSESPKQSEQSEPTIKTRPKRKAAQAAEAARQTQAILRSMQPDIQPKTKYNASIQDFVNDFLETDRKLAEEDEKKEPQVVYLDDDDVGAPKKSHLDSFTAQAMMYLDDEKFLRKTRNIVAKDLPDGLKSQFQNAYNERLQLAAHDNRVFWLLRRLQSHQARKRIEERAERMQSMDTENPQEQQLKARTLDEFMDKQARMAGQDYFEQKQREINTDELGLDQDFELPTSPLAPSSPVRQPPTPQNTSPLSPQVSSPVDDCSHFLDVVRKGKRIGVLESDSEDADDEEDDADDTDDADGEEAADKTDVEDSLDTQVINTESQETHTQVVEGNEENVAAVLRTRNRFALNTAVDEKRLFGLMSDSDEESPKLAKSANSIKLGKPVVLDLAGPTAGKPQNLLDDLAIESEDEFAGIEADQSDNEDDDGELDGLIDHEQTEVDRTAARLAFAEEERTKDEAMVRRICDEVLNGKRSVRSHHGLLGTGDSDNDETMQESLRLARETRKRARLLEDKFIAKLATNTKTQAFFETVSEDIVARPSVYIQTESQSISEQLRFLDDSGSSENEDFGAPAARGSGLSTLRLTSFQPYSGSVHQSFGGTTMAARVAAESKMGPRVQKMPPSAPPTKVGKKVEVKRCLMAPRAIIARPNAATRSLFQRN